MSTWLPRLCRLLPMGLISLLLHLERRIVSRMTEGQEKDGKAGLTKD